MADIEFFAPGAEPVYAEEFGVPVTEEVEAGPAEPPRQRWLTQIPTTGAAALWAAAAALAVLAPFRTVFTEQIRGTSSQVLAADGWGRVAYRGDFSGFVAHFPRYGVPLVITSCLCAVLALIVAVAAWRGRQVPGPFGKLVLPAAGVLAGGVMIGVAAATWQNIQASRDALSGEARVVGFEDLNVPTLQVGPFCLLAGLAGLAALLGSAAAWFPVPAQRAEVPQHEPAAAQQDALEPPQAGQAVPGPIDQDYPSSYADRTDDLTITAVASHAAPLVPADGEELLGR